MFTVHDFCCRILDSGDLASKLLPPLAADGTPLVDQPADPLRIDRPARDPAIRLRQGAEKLPRLKELAPAHARAQTLARFAHHELLAVELFAWALLRWPDLPPPLRRGFLLTLAEEQAHLSLYLERLQALGSKLEEHRLSDYLWMHLPAIERGGPLAFLAAMGLTFEQANLDFSLLYRDAFRNVGDEESAQVMQQVHDDEVGHVKLAAHWFGRLKNPAQSDVEAYVEVIPFPLSAARAKGRRFDVGARRRAGLSDEMIEHVRAARPYERPVLHRAIESE